MIKKKLCQNRPVYYISIPRINQEKFLTLGLAAFGIQLDIYMNVMVRIDNWDLELDNCIGILADIVMVLSVLRYSGIG